MWPLTVRGTGALALAITCFVLAGELGLIELVYFGVLLLATLVASLVSLYLTRHTESVVRTLSPDVATVGRTGTVTVRVGVRTAVPAPAGVWRDTVPRGFSGAAHGVFPAIGSGLRGNTRAIELNYTLTATRRGVHPLGPLSVTSHDPFGLARRSNVLGMRTQVTVAPAIIELPPLANFAGASGGSLHTTTSQLGQGAEQRRSLVEAGDSLGREAKALGEAGTQSLIGALDEGGAGGGRRRSVCVGYPAHGGGLEPLFAKQPKSHFDQLVARLGCAGHAVTSFSERVQKGR